MYSYGIDLGLNSSCIAIETFNNGIKTVELNGKPSIPSYVYYNKSSKILCVGEIAKNTKGVTKYSLLYDSKKYIGKKWYEVDKNKKKYKLVNAKNSIKYELVHNNNTIYVSPINVTSKIIEYIDLQAVQYLSYKKLSKDNYNLAIGVPSSFTSKQRYATITAAEQAGLKNIYLIPEPVAAVLAYVGEKAIQLKKNYILVYELRSNYFKASIVICSNNEFRIINESQDNGVGGDYFTKILIDYYLKEVGREEYDSNHRNNEKKMKRITMACENAKKCLTMYEETSIYVEDDDLEVSISRSLFEEKISGYINKTIDIINDLLDGLAITLTNIDCSILVGRSCLIPKIKSTLSHYGKVLYSINPDEVVAKGCAHYANNLKKYIIKYSLPRSLSFELTIKDLPLYSYGIDLGTTFSHASFIRLGKINMVNTNSSQSNSFPSCVAYKDDYSVVVGDAAYNMKMKKDVSFVYDSKRFIGIDYDDIDEDEMKLYPFKLVKKENIPVYNISVKDRIISVLPIDVESKIIRYIHNYTVESMFAIPKEIDVKDILVAVGVPAFFTNKQRLSIIEAAKQAGLVNVQLIEEPVAAVLAYLEASDIINRKVCKIMVYDFGGGTFNVTIINLNDNNIEILETNGDNHLGGEDITRKIEEYIKKIYNINIEKNDRYKMRIHAACEKTKVILSQMNDCNFDLSLEDIEYDIKFCRSKLNEICKDIFQRTIDMLNSTLNKCNLKPDDIDYIILVGGSSRIPAIEGYIKQLFKGNGIICRSINPDEAVAIGCGIYARSLYTDDFSRYKIHNKFKSSSEDGMNFVNEEMIKRFSSYPCKITKRIYCKDSFRQIQIYESDEYYHKKRHMIDSIELTKSKNGYVEVTFELNEKGNLTVLLRSEDNNQYKRTYTI